MSNVKNLTLTLAGSETPGSVKKSHVIVPVLSGWFYCANHCPQSAAYSAPPVHILGGVPPGCFFLDYLLSRTGGCQCPNKTGEGCFIFTIAASFFFSMHLTAATCLNSRLLAVWCLKRKAGPIRKVKIYGLICCLMIIIWGMVNSSSKKITPVENVDVGNHFTGKATFPTSTANHGVV